MLPDRFEATEKPQNGIRGLAYWRHDILAGIAVSLVSLPLSSGIAIASGVPPVIGLISAIIAGLIFPFVGGAYLTISGPAAGLAPAIMAIMISLGGAGDAEKVGLGFPFLLVIVCMVGGIQIVLSLLKMARFAAIIPTTVVGGMLASIGLLIIVKQVPTFFGFDGPIRESEFIDLVVAIPKYIQGINPRVFTVAFLSLVLLFVLERFRTVTVLKVIPPQLIAVIFGVILGIAFEIRSLGPGYLITIPDQPLQGLHSPDFGALLTRSDLWQAAFVGVILLTMIDGIESLATAMAIDRIDPFHRKSDPNRVLLAMGISNVVSSMVGGLTIIPGGVKSKVNISAGGRTLWANFTNAICLLVYLLYGSTWISMIPLGVLSSVLIYTGWKMCEPLVWRQIANTGREQLVIFAFTVIVTLLTNLLIGILAGVAFTFVLDASLCRAAIVLSSPSAGVTLSTWKCVADFFCNPVYERQYWDHAYHIYVGKPLVCFNTMQLAEELDEVPSDARSICIHVNERVILIDHTAAENLKHFIQESSHANIPVQIVGLERLSRLSSNDASTRLAMSHFGANRNSPVSDHQRTI